jgi:hypothetical protein
VVSEQNVDQRHYYPATWEQFRARLSDQQAYIAYLVKDPRSFRQFDCICEYAAGRS